jgi:peptidyl-prolyl cis-trans isomerase C
MRLNIPVLLEDAPPKASAGAKHASAPAHGHPHADDDHADDPSQPLPGPAPVLVHVGDTAISEAEIAREMQHHRSADPQRARLEAARALVVRELLRIEIAAQGIAEAGQLQGAETQEEAAIRLLLEREIHTPEPSEDACRRYFESNRERMRTPSSARVRHILLAAPPADAFARNKARELGEQLIEILRLEPERFAELAAQHSSCPSKQDGGALGWISSGDTVPEFERQVFRLKPGMAGLTVESRYGHHVVVLEALREGEALSFSDCQPRIASYLEAQAKQNALHQYLNILAERHGVQGVEMVD